jgi:hypothetical protein
MSSQRNEVDGDLTKNFIVPDSNATIQSPVKNTRTITEFVVFNKYSRNSADREVRELT